MPKEVEHDDDDAVVTMPEEPQFNTSSHRRLGWLLIGGFVLLIAFLIGAELVRRP